MGRAHSGSGAPDRCARRRALALQHERSALPSRGRARSGLEIPRHPSRSRECPGVGIGHRVQPTLDRGEACPAGCPPRRRRPVRRSVAPGATALAARPPQAVGRVAAGAAVESHERIPLPVLVPATRQPTQARGPADVGPGCREGRRSPASAKSTRSDPSLDLAPATPGRLSPSGSRRGS